MEYMTSIEKHQLCVNILKGIKEFENRKECLKESFKRVVFPELKQSCLNDIDIINRCIDRLYSKYERITNTNENKLE